MTPGDAERPKRNKIKIKTWIAQAACVRVPGAFFWRCRRNWAVGSVSGHDAIAISRQYMRKRNLDCPRLGGVSIPWRKDVASRQ